MKYIRSQNAVKREIAGETFLVPVRQKLADMQNLFVLHGCGEFVWDQIASPTAKEDLIEKLTGQYDVSSTDASSDIDKFLKDLSDADLVNSVS